MSHYTTQVRWIIETNSTEGNPMSSRISEASSKIFDFEYPIWDNSYKPTLEKKILLHYFNKEIGFETVGLWKLYLEEKMNLIMPYYIELYKTVIAEYDFLSDTNMTENELGETQSNNTSHLENSTDSKSSNQNIGSNHSTTLSSENGNNTNTIKEHGVSTANHDEKNDSTNKITDASTGTVDKENKATTIKSDYPQAKIGLTDYASESNLIDTSDTTTNNLKYTSSNEGADNKNIKVDNDNTVDKTDHNVLHTDFTTDTNGNTTTNFSSTQNGNLNQDGSNNQTGSHERTKTRKGANGSRSLSELIMDKRKTLINIDSQIVAELYDLFMLIY